jgi:hypothetical protein
MPKHSAVRPVTVTPCLFLPEPDEFRMPEMTVRRPFSKLYPGHKFGPQPVAVFYFVSYDGGL